MPCYAQKAWLARFWKKIDAAEEHNLTTMQKSKEQSVRVHPSLPPLEAQYATKFIQEVVDQRLRAWAAFAHLLYKKAEQSAKRVQIRRGRELEN